MSHATLAVMNATLYTGDNNHPQFSQAMAVKDDRIIAIGTNQEIAALTGPSTKVIDAESKLVMPGFIDAHTHLCVGGFQLLSIDLRDARSEHEFSKQIAARAKTLAPGQWLTGGNWDHEQWPTPHLPVKELIDSSTQNTPVFVTRLDLHMGLANSAALKLAGITKDTPDPSGGSIVRHPQTGEPTGILKDAAMDLVWRTIAQPTIEDYFAAIRAALRHAASLGITSVQDVTSWEEWQVLKAYQKEHGLTTRIYARTPVREWEKQKEVLATDGPGDSWLRLGGVKGFMDGSLGSTTALFFEPYSDTPGEYGLLHDDMHPAGAMQSRLVNSDRAGLQASIHAIGDKANHLLLNMVEQVQSANGLRDRRFRIEHAQHLIPSDVERMATLGVIASVQPYHAIDDARWADRRLGDRTKMAYPFRSLLQADVPLAFGTDWPVAPLNPLLGIYAAVTRKPFGEAFSSWHPDQCLSVEEAVQAYTASSAYAEFAEENKGTLSPGKLADFIILSQNILAIPPDTIPSVNVDCTVCGGKVVYEK